MRRGTLSRLNARLQRRIYARAQTVPVAYLANASWRKSTFSNYNGSCVQVARLPDGRIAISDSKDGRHGPALVLSSAEWALVLAGARNDVPVGTQEEQQA